MEKDSLSLNLPTGSFDDFRRPHPLFVCSNCEKPFGNKNSRDRHVSYCGRRTRRRPQSCLACNAAKTKCSFDTPCSRCMKKGIECHYTVPAPKSQILQPGLSSGIPSKANINEFSNTLVSNQLFQADIVTPSIGPFSFASDPLTDENRSYATDVGTFPSFDSNTDFLSGAKSFTFGDIPVFNENVPVELQCPLDVELISPDKPVPHYQSWCKWMVRRDVSLIVVTDRPAPQPNPSLIASLHMRRPHAQHNAEIIIQSIRSLPIKMMRKETFPWFIHPESHLLSITRKATMPEALSTCMSIAHMFASRTSETRRFLWRTIQNECRNFTSEMSGMSKFDVLAAIQACMIYLIMYIVDYSAEHESSGLELRSTLNALYTFAKTSSLEEGDCSQLLHFGSTWEDWIFAESQRRLVNLWFLIGCAVYVKSGKVYDSTESYRSILLPSPKSMWEAPSRSIWRSEYEANFISQQSGLVTLGDLLDAQETRNSLSSSRKLDLWNAGIDNLGSLMNLMGTML